jgi:ribosomal protein S12 methylthiotransferase
LGCPKNEVDGETIRGYLARAGVDFVSRPEQADYLIVNTCGFIRSAKEESLAAILDLAAVKSDNGGKRLLVTGCLAQRYCDQLLKDIPEIDGMIGIDQYDRIVELLDRDAALVTPPHSSYREFEPPLEAPRRRYAYLKIADGCDSGCSYCAIPHIRGHYRSRNLKAIERDIDRYLGAGALEINLIAQDVARYGYDIGKSPLDLLDLLERRPEDFWLRPFYLHPRNITEELLEFLGSSQKFCRYLEVPVQHASTRILKMMNRGYDERYLYDLFERIKSTLPDTVLRTTFIVGFLGETKDDFSRLTSFVENIGFARGGVFVYSREEGTMAFQLGRLPASSRIRERQEILENLISENAERFNRALIGQTLPMLPETWSQDSSEVIGRLYCDAPEIDYQTALQAIQSVSESFVKVRITDVSPTGFAGVPAGEGEKCLRM